MTKPDLRELTRARLAEAKARATDSGILGIDATGQIVVLTGALAISINTKKETMESIELFQDIFGAGAIGTTTTVVDANDTRTKVLSLADLARFIVRDESPTVSPISFGEFHRSRRRRR
jgi:hypothetical protein